MASSGTFSTQSLTKHEKFDMPPSRKEASLSPLPLCHRPLFKSCPWPWLHEGLSAFSIYYFLSLGLPVAEIWSLIWKASIPLVTSGVSSPGKHIVPTLKVYSLKSSSCIFIRMKYRALCSVQGFINDVLSGAGCSAYLHIKQLSEETFLLLLQGINQFKASSHHLYSFQLSLLLLK